MHYTFDSLALIIGLIALIAAGILLLIFGRPS